MACGCLQSVDYRFLVPAWVGLGFCTELCELVQYHTYVHSGHLCSWAFSAADAATLPALPRCTVNHRQSMLSFQAAQYLMLWQLRRPPANPEFKPYRSHPLQLRKDALGPYGKSCHDQASECYPRLWSPTHGVQDSFQSRLCFS